MKLFIVKKMFDIGNGAESEIISVTYSENEAIEIIEEEIKQLKINLVDEFKYESIDDLENQKDYYYTKYENTNCYAIDFADYWYRLDIVKCEIVGNDLV